MSRAMDFIHALQTDTALRMKATQLGPDDVESLIDIAALHGYVFDRDEWSRAVREFEAREPAAAHHGSLSRIPGFQM